MQITPAEFDSQATRVEDAAESLAETGAEVEGSALDHSELEANADQRKSLRRNVDKAELRLALRDITEGLRGFIRVAPLTALFAGVAVGVAIGAKKRRPANRRA